MIVNDQNDLMVNTCEKLVRDLVKDNYVSKHLYHSYLVRRL